MTDKKKPQNKAAQMRPDGMPIGTPFGPDNKPKGRPKGSRHKLGEAFLQDLYSDWQEHGKDAIVKVRDDKPDAYLKEIR